jgi:hypothetical protein
MFTPFQHLLASHVAMTVLGYRRDGRPIYPIAGGNGEGEGATDTSGGSADAGQTGQQAQADGQQTTTQTQQGTATTTAAQAGANESAATIARLEKQLADARKEAGAARTNAKAQAADEARTALAQEIGKALGLVKDDTPPDPAELTKQIAAHTARVAELETAGRAKDIELAVHSLAEKHQAKVSALLDSRGFVKTIRQLDPADKDFTTQLDAAIKKAVADNPSFRSAPPAGRSGADLTGGTGEATKPRTTSLGAAIRGHYGT